MIYVWPYVSSILPMRAKHWYSGSRRHAADGLCENESPMNAAIPERRPATEQISGLIERVTFHNEDSSFCVQRVKTAGGALGVERR